MRNKSTQIAFRILVLSFSLFVSSFLFSQSLEWGKVVGGTADEYSRTLETDHLGNLYIGGTFEGTVDFNPGTGVTNASTGSNFDANAFIQKLDASGNFKWVRTIGNSTEDETIVDLKIDSNSNVYSIGSFSGTVDFDPGTSSTTISSNGVFDLFVHKLDSSGNLIWVKTIGSSSARLGPSSIVIGKSGDLFIYGNFFGTVDFDPGPGINAHSSPTSAPSAFIIRMDQNGVIKWAKSFGGQGSISTSKMALDSDENIFTTGSFIGNADFDPSPFSSFNLTSSQVPNGFYNSSFVEKLDSLGNFLWVRAFHGTENNGGSAINVDAGGNIYSTGWYRDSIDLDPGTGHSYFSHQSFQPSLYVQKMSPSGSFIWGKSVGSTSTTISVLGSDIDAFGNFYITGTYAGTVDLDPGANTSISTSNGYDVFIQKFDSLGNLAWVTTYGGLYQDEAYDIEVDKNNKVYTSGMYLGNIDLDPSNNIYIWPTAGGVDMFIQKLSQMTTDLSNQKASPTLSYRIYPNPTEDNTQLQLSNSLNSVSLELRDLSGRLISSKFFNKLKTTRIELPENSGIYFLTVNSLEEQKTIKLIRK